MSTLTFTHHAAETLREMLHLPVRARPAAVARPAAPGGPQLSLLDRIDRWFDGWTDDRAELERYLARAQNIADLENRMRDALDRPPPLRF
jgi:hypothetical protein